MSDYHAHVYFDAETRARAADLRERIGAAFPVEIGRFHEKPVGPHPCWSFQVAFAADQFGTVVPWLMRHREGLTVLLHPNTGDALGDHTHRAAWMGEIPELNLAIFEAATKDEA